ncbi:MAG: hypothetical protein KJ063_22160 [Anaerolineae bacterium]|nr:hypothetical protein [Anaerolineae bacterium]
MIEKRSQGWGSVLRHWVVNHDDSWLFVGLYIGLAVILSIWISLFWLVAVVAAHFALEWVRQSHKHRGWPIFAEVLWELKLDVALIFFALALALYMDVILGIVGLQAATRIGAAARTGVRGSARFAAWERMLRGALLSIDDAAQVVKAVKTSREKGDSAAIETAEAASLDPSVLPDNQPASRWGSWADKWGHGDYIAVGLGLICVIMILAAPWLTAHTAATALAALAHELRPFPVIDPE